MAHASSEQRAGIPNVMTVAAARFFAADWESASFLEFFLDLQLRVSEDDRSTAGRTRARLADHARFALQSVLVRSVDSYLAYLGEIEAAVARTRRGLPWNDLLVGGEPRRRAGVPITAGEHYWPAVAHGNVRQIDRLFGETTGVHVFLESKEVDKIARLVSLRNLIAHGRTFAATDLAALVEETVSVDDLGLKLAAVREDFDYLRSSVTRIDEGVAAQWQLPRPITSSRLLEAIAAASKVSPVDRAEGLDAGTRDC